PPAAARPASTSARLMPVSASVPRRKKSRRVTGPAQTVPGVPRKDFCFSVSGMANHLVLNEPNFFLSIAQGTVTDHSSSGQPACLVFGVWCLVFGVWCLVFRVSAVQTPNTKHQIRNTKHQVR